MPRWSRPLTPGEIAMARSIFRDAVDYARVRIHDSRYLPFGLQPRHVCMTPNGHMYFSALCFRHDFSAESVSARHWFMHEMVHVWQHQLGYPVKLRGAIRLGLSYDYALAPDRRLGDYNMEAQGDLLADYFVLRYLTAGSPERAADLADYETVLGDFLADPADPLHLPGGRKRRARAALAD